MTTTAARMYQRRRTAAQWTSENPVLAAGEIGLETGGTFPLIKIGDGTTAWTSLAYYDLQTFYRFTAGAARIEGAATESTFQGWPSIAMPAAGTSTAIFAVSMPAVWTTGSMSWGYSPVAGGNNVRWNADVLRVNALGFGDLLTDAPQTTDTFTQAAGTTNQMEHCFNHPATYACHNGDAVFGEVVRFRIQRLGDDVADTSTSVVHLINFSINRLT